MAQSNPLDILLIQGRWANENVFDAIEPLTNEQLHQQFEMGPGSIHDTMRHVLGAMRGWSDFLAGREQRPRVETEGEKTVAQMRELHTVIADELDVSARLGSPDDVISGERGGRTFSFPRGGVVTHVMTHGFHHRAQVANMLRQIGVETQPRSSVVDWMLLVDPVEAPTA